MSPFQSLRSYEEFIYTLPQTFLSIQRSTLVVERRGALLATVRGELYFSQNYRVTIRERLNFEGGVVVLEFYGYELWLSDEKFAWYDPQPHPHIAELQSTHPHHKHIAPNIKHNRVPAPNMSFTKPNIPSIIDEIETLLKQGN